MSFRMTVTQSNQSRTIQYWAFTSTLISSYPPSELQPKWCSHIPLWFASYITPITRTPVMYSPLWIGSLIGRSSFLKGVNLLVHILYSISACCLFCDTAVMRFYANCKTQNVFCCSCKNSDVGVQRFLFQKGELSLRKASVESRTRSGSLHKDFSSPVFG